METKTIANVPICEVGMDFPASTGTLTLTEKMLMSAVAAQQDSAIKSPRIKLHHDGPLNEAEMGDAECKAAFGVIENLRYSHDDMTLYGDFSNMPSWLADIAPVAYPSRSLEGVHMLKTVTGKEWEFVITAVALLGVEWPGVSTIPDLQAAFSTEGPKGVTVKDRIAAAFGRGNKDTKAETNVDDVRKSFYNDFATDESGRYWWWIRAIYIDPMEIIADDDDGDLYRIPYTVNNEEVTFGDPQSVKIQYVNAEAARIAAEAMNAYAGERVAAEYKEAAVSRPDTREKEVKATMDPKKAREAFGLAEDASDDELREAVKKANLVAEPETKVDTPEGDPAEDQAEQQEVAAKVKDDGTVQIDKDTYDRLLAGSQAGLEARQAQRNSDRDTLINAAVREGKFPPARADHWKTLYDADPEGTKETISKLAAGMIPVAEKGGQGRGEDVQDEASEVAVVDDWFPHAKARREAVASADPANRIHMDKSY